MSYNEECPHCDGEGICQDDYHDSGINEAGADFVLGSDCPSGCSGSSLGAGKCPHCNGHGTVQD